MNSNKTKQLIVKKSQRKSQKTHEDTDTNTFTYTGVP